MIEQTATSRFIVPPSGIQERLYQELFRGIAHYHQLGERLIHLAEQAKSFKQIDSLSELALILSNFPIEHYRLIGQYYLALSICRDGQGNLEQAATILEKVASNGPMIYRAEAMISLSAIFWVKQQPEETIRYCLEATKAGNLNTTIKALKGIAVLKGREGSHRSALNDLEKLFPMFQHASPYAYFDYLNSYAVELSETGQLEKARNISTLVCNSPFAPYDRAWQETQSEVNQKLHKSRSTVAVSIPKSKPQVKAKPKPAQEPNLAKILQFPKPKAKEFYKGMEMPDLTPIQWLAAMMKTKFGAFIKVFIPDADDEIDRFCATYLDFVITFYD